MNPLKRTAAWLLGLSACTGSVGSPAGPIEGSFVEDSEPGSVDEQPSPYLPNVDGTRAPLCSSEDNANIPGPRLLRRLTKPEFENNVRSAFGLDPSAWGGSTLPPDSAAQNGFTNQADQLRVSDSFAERLMESAESVGDVVSTPSRLSSLLSCANSGGVSCAEEFLDRFGKRLYRRPLGDDERRRYLELLDEINRVGGTFPDWIKWATAGLVSSPHAIYRSEVGDESDEGRFALSGYELATALAFTFTGTPPNDALLSQAAQGRLKTKADLRAVATQLALDETGAPRPAFREQFARFVGQWLGLSALANRQKDESKFPDWSNSVSSAMDGEVKAFLDHVVFDAQGGMNELLTAPYTMLNGTLAKFYGFGQATGASFEETTRPSDWGVGLLAQGALLSLKSTNRDTSPTQRGHMVRDRILCYEVPPPPPTVGLVPDATGAETTRQRYEDLHPKNNACAGCHRLMDPIGFGLEHLDASGRYRANENGFAIDDSGKLVATSSSESDISFDGPVELAAALAEREAAGACLGAFYASFVFGLDRRDTSCLVADARTQLASGSLSMLDFMLALVDSPHFTERAE